MALKILDARAAESLIREGARLIDIRDAEAYLREHVRGAQLSPVSKMTADGVTLDASSALIFYCKAGNRTKANAATLAAVAPGEAYILDGGIEAWKAAGLPVEQRRGQPIEIMRQVQIAVGSLVLAGLLLGIFANPLFYGVSALMGAGLVFAGVSGWCGMAKIIGKMPWNRHGQSAALSTV